MADQSTENGLAFLCHPYHRGGVTTWMAGAAREWRRRQRPCWFVAPEPRSRSLTSGGSCAVIELLGADAATPAIIAPRVGPSFEFGTSVLRASVLRRALAEVPEGVPVVVSNDPDVWLAAVQLADRNPVIGVLHADEDAYYALARRYADSVAALVAVSSRIGTKARQMLPASTLEVAVIPCGIPTAEVLSRPRPSHRVLRLLWVGRIEEHQKRVSDLVRVAAALQRGGVDFELRVIGDGPDRDALRRAAANAGVADRFAWTGWSSSNAVRVFMRASDILLLPSNFEGMPVVAMEALAEGCAVVASRVSGIEGYEHATLGAQCLRVHAIGDIHAAAAAVTKLATVPDAVRQQRAWAFARAEFDIGVSVDRYEGVASGVRAAAPRARVPVADDDVAPWHALPRAWFRWARTWVAHRA